jgi:IS605 OrfB family transposase
MKLTAKVKLKPTTEQKELLEQTLETANLAANHISEIAWAEKTFRQFSLHKLVYYDVKEQFGLTAQMTVRVISKVSDAYKLDKETKRMFKLNGSIAYDSRILRYYDERGLVSIWAMGGRQKIKFVAGQRQKDLLKFQKGESDLVKIGGDFYLFATCQIDDPDEIDPEAVLGVDLGIVNIATDSDGKQHSGSQVNSVRKRRRRQRKRLQMKGTKSAKRVAKRLSGKERRFSKDVNHQISKRIVKKAERTGCAIALEKLKGIRQRIRARKPQRTTLHSWAFADLIEKIKYKAALAGIPVIEVNPAYTSQTCTSCGHRSKSNRKSQSVFLCAQCGLSANTDVNAAKNISVLGWAVVNQPDGEVCLSDCYPQAQAL